MSKKPWEEKVFVTPTIEQMRRAQKTNTSVIFVLSRMGRVNVKVSTLRTHPLEIKESVIVVSGTTEWPVGRWFWKKVQTLVLDITCFPNRRADKGIATMIVLTERKV